MRSERPIYLDHNATTPVDPRVLDAMLPYFTERFGNPSSVEHRHGNEVQMAVERARAQVAASLSARETEIVFTGSCTEANNLAIFGAARADPHRRHLITSAIEHPAVLEPMRQLAREGFDITVLGVDHHGRVSPDDVRAAMRADTALVSIMGANNEVGTIQPIAAIGAICAEHGILFHTDLAQVMAHRSVDVGAENIHLASLSGHKAYGPKGVGALYVRSRSPRARLQPMIFGGGQEKSLRPGTVNVPLVVGLGKAIEIAVQEMPVEGPRLNVLSAHLLDRITSAIDGVELNGHPVERIHGNLSLSIAGVEPLALMHRLNPIASFSASSACATNKVETSHVLKAMFGDTPRAREAFRVSPGRFTSPEEMEFFAGELVASVAELRRFAA